jgi:hypothetical protein
MPQHEFSPSSGIESPTGKQVLAWWPIHTILESNVCLRLALQAPGGAIVLTSQDLHRWQRVRWQPQSNQTMAWPLNIEEAMGFYQVLSP